MMRFLRSLLLHPLAAQAVAWQTAEEAEVKQHLARNEYTLVACKLNHPKIDVL